MSKKELTNQLKKAYESLEEEFKNKGIPNTIEDNNVDYDNCNIYAMRQKITDLEAKLAESNTKSYTLESYNNFLNNQCKKLIKENKQLKQQLAEKDKEIKQLKLDLGMFKSTNEFINRYGIEKAREVLLQTEKTKRQDKIEFAVEQLSKTRNFVNGQEIFSKHKCESKVCRDILQAIDNQIQQLKASNSIPLEDKEGK